MKLKRLETVDEVLGAFGDTAEVMKLTHVSTPQAVANWSARGAFPPGYYVVMTTWLNRHGFDAPAALWNQIEADDPNSKKEPGPQPRESAAVP